MTILSAAVAHEPRRARQGSTASVSKLFGRNTGTTEQDGILMIEDCTSDADLVRAAFKRAGVSHRLRVIPNCEEGLDYLFGAGTCASDTPGRPQLILLDLDLPGMSGIEFLRCVKEDAHTRDIPVVILSQSETDRNIMTCVRLGAGGYIVKPLTIETLIRVAAKLNLPLTISSGPHQ